MWHYCTVSLVCTYVAYQKIQSNYISEGSVSHINGVRPDFPRNTACWSLNK